LENVCFWLSRWQWWIIQIQLRFIHVTTARISSRELDSLLQDPRISLESPVDDVIHNDKTHVSPWCMHYGQSFRLIAKSRPWTKAAFWFNMNFA
jgi:hypothetical protein